MPVIPMRAGSVVRARATVVAPLTIPEPRDGLGAGTRARGAVVVPRKMPDERP